MKKITAISLVILFVFATSFFTFAHPGRTDSRGGHRNSSTGDYHYHHGYSAHQHPNGECPYEFDDKTGSSSIETTSSKTTSTNVDSYIRSNNIMLYIAAIVLLVGLVIFISIKYNKNVKEQEKQSTIQNEELTKRNLQIIKQGNIIAQMEKELLEQKRKNKNTVESNNNAVEAIRQFYFEHTGNILKCVNENPDRIALYIDKVLQKIDALLEKDDTNFKLIPTYTSRVSYVYNVHLIQYSEYVKNKYEEKLYTVSAFDKEGESYGFERYLIAENNLHILLIQCVLIEPELTLSKESVYALYSTYYKLKKNANKTIHLVIICNSTLSDETKDLAMALKINYKERVRDPFLEPDSPKTDI